VDYGTAFSQLDVFDFSFSLEGTPHAAVHVQVGGLMGSVPTAANDPIFWLHHANIDRLWEGWLGWGEGRHNPEEPHPWLDQTYTFYDENAQQVSLTGRQILNTRRQLRYRYDSLPPRPSPSPTRATSAPETRRAVQERREQRIAENTRLSLGQAPTTVTLRMEADPAANLREALERAEGLTSVQLVFEGVDYEPGSYYEIFINLPGDPAEARSDGPHFAGVIAPFVDPKHAGHALRVNVRPALARLQAQGLIGGTDLALTFVPRGPVPPQGQPPRPVTARMQAERLSLVIR
jgi:tyrosinase